MLTIQWTAIGVLKPNPRNARTHNKRQIRQIAASITSFGFVVPIVVSEDGTIISGHGRYAAALLLGLKTVPTIEVRGLSEAKLRALALADNKIAENAGWDRERLAIELPELSELLVSTGLIFRSPASRRWRSIRCRTTSRRTRAMDKLDPAWADAEVVSRPGDLWQLGSHRLLCGDARKGRRLARLDERAGLDGFPGSAIQCPCP